ncbi:MAG: NAD(+) synthase [Bacteroidales bacterium]|nr:NAD(+) synthase [Bacteroidales bacterium]
MNCLFNKVAAATPLLRVADTNYNAEKIIEIINDATKKGAEIIVFPELCITSASCGDMFKNGSLLISAKKALSRIIEETKNLNSTNIVGLPIASNDKIYNCAVVFKKGEIIDVTSKQLLSHNESRWFSFSNNKSEIIKAIGCTDNCQYSNSNNISVAIGKDLVTYDNNYSNEIVAIPFVFPEIIGYYDSIQNRLKSISKTKQNVIILASAGMGESSTDYAYAGATLIVENGKILAEGKRFSNKNSFIITDIDINQLKQEREHKENYINLSNIEPENNIELSYENDYENILRGKIRQNPFIPEDKDALSKRCEEIFNIQTYALIKRFEHTYCNKAVIGISGGLDSTLALLVAVNAFDKMGIDRANITAITMPGFGTTNRTYNNAVNMIKELGATFKEISIKDACLQHFKDIEHDINIHNVTYENSQARERTQILMDYANKISALHLGTGDMSELALGWATYNGDHISMYNVNCSIPKTLAKYMVDWVAQNNKGVIRDILMDVVNTPISPELTPADENGNIKQKTEDIVGPYELHDFFIYYLLRYNFSVNQIFSLAKTAFEGKYENDYIKHWLKIFIRRFFTQQFKRSCLNDGPAVGVISLSPRGGLNMPSDISSNIWLDECDKL